MGVCVLRNSPYNNLMRIKDTDDGLGELLPRERIFIQEFLKDFNGTQAIIRSKIKVKTNAVASTLAGRYLARPRVQKGISEAVKSIQDKAEVNVAMIIKELHRIATTDIADIFDEKGNIKRIHDIPLDIRRAISGFEVETPISKPDTKIVKVKLWSKEKSLEMLGKHLQMWIEKIQLSGDIQLVYGHRKPKEEEAK
jgi:phage terminase small subunit